MLLLKALLYIVSVIIAFWAIVLIVSADTSKELGRDATSRAPSPMSESDHPIEGIRQPALAPSRSESR